MFKKFFLLFLFVLLLSSKAFAWNHTQIHLPTPAQGTTPNYRLSQQYTQNENDVNGDGYPDIVITQHGYDAQDPTLARVYIVYGGPQLPSYIDLANYPLDGVKASVIENVHSAQTNGFSIMSVTTDKDYNYDNINDVTIFTFNSSFTESQRIVVLGSQTLPGKIDAQLDLNGSNGFLTNPLGATTGFAFNGGTEGNDFNSDGFEDYAITPYPPGGAGFWVIYGTGNVSFPALIKPGSFYNQTNGFLVQPYGTIATFFTDLNGDEINDNIFSVHNYDFVNQNKTKIMVLYNPEGGITGNLQLSTKVLDGTNGFQITGLISAYGNPMTELLDINGDGLKDLVISTYRTTLDDGSGDAFVIFASKEPMPATLDVSELDGTNGFRLKNTGGLTMSNIPKARHDLNKDGKADMVLQTPNPQKPSTPGQIYVVFGQEEFSDGEFDFGSLDGHNGFTILPSDVGIRLTVTADFNGDGFNDYLLDSLGGETQRTFVLFGKAQMPAVIDLKTFAFNGNNGFEVIGFPEHEHDPSALERDFNGDGLAELEIQVDRTRYIVFGRNNLNSGTIDFQTLNGQNGYTIVDPRIDAKFTQEQLVGTDFNKDGKFDHVLSYPNETGKLEDIYIVYGQTGSEAILDVSKFTSLLLGDLNNDKKVDLTDFGILKVNFGKNGPDGDVNLDGKVDLTDFGLLKTNFGKTGNVDLSILDQFAEFKEQLIASRTLQMYGSLAKTPQSFESKNNTN